MSSTAAGSAATPSASTWEDAAFRESLQLIAEGITDVVGFGVALINVVRGDDLVVAAIAGVDGARTVSGVQNTLDEMLGTRWPVELYLQELELADDWGMFKFVPQERIVSPDPAGWVPDMEPLHAPDAWHPMDLLTAPIHDADGNLRGVVAIDVPDDGRRPGPAKRRLLEKYAVQAARAVLTALEREDLAEQVRMLTTARQAIREASRNLDLTQLLEQTRESLLAGFGADALRMLVFEGRGARYALDDILHSLDPVLAGPARRAAGAAWERQETLVLTVDGVRGMGLDAAALERVLGLFGPHGADSVLYVPIGAGSMCLGSFVVVRAAGSREWSDAEREVALSIGRDLGRAVSNARAYSREQRLGEDLRELSASRGRLVTTLSDELRGPIREILANLEALDDHPMAPGVAPGLAAVGRGATRLLRITDDLALLATVTDPRRPLMSARVELLRVVEDAVQLFAATAEQRGVRIQVSARSPVVALGDAAELDPVVTNLLSNAVKYTPDGGRVLVSLERSADEVVLEVRDEGLGISPEDLPRLFSEFFRSTNPRAKAIPGTGLGLTIVDRIVTRHHGRVEVESELGRGSVFRVHLPAG